jgi:hypothetical protein
MMRVAASVNTSKGVPHFWWRFTATSESCGFCEIEKLAQDERPPGSAGEAVEV